VSFGQHALMKDAGNQNTIGVLSVKDNVLAALHSPKAGTNIVTRSAQSGIIGKHLATGLKIVEVSDSLVFAPGAKRISSDAEQVGFGMTREAKRGHGLALRRAKVECFPDARKWVAFGNTAGVAFINGRAQGGKLRLVQFFLTSQGPQRCAHDLAGVFVATTRDLLQHEAVKLVGQIDISGRHGGCFLDWGDSKPILLRLAKIANRPKPDQSPSREEECPHEWGMAA
jgi:hypothetical protein